ncbi:hypothetical protein BCR34DRAFT_614642 [Clohesyomyces aquaticus]|uniref:Uncharacterized protein n=1 Tax=Clohesyomyces aquaticus TaxID=1231657 RepID=A0A1Y1ZM20_9PLEO|nr:hypothetical protein BCR34DRAFT_614642 [Clohesyomyces aquaticus]
MSSSFVFIALVCFAFSETIWSLERHEPASINQSISALALYNSSCEWLDQDACRSSWPYHAEPCNQTNDSFYGCQVPYFNQSIFMQALERDCAQFQKPVEACSDDYTARRSAAEVWSLCFSQLFADYYQCNASDPLSGSDKSGNVQYSMNFQHFGEVHPVEIVNETCSYPPLTQVLRISCDRIIGYLESKSWCCQHTGNYEPFSGEEITCRFFERETVNYEILACQTEAAIHYTRCTAAGMTTLTEVGYCVRNATLGLGWFNYDFLVDNGDLKCPTLKSFTRRLILWNVCALIIIVFLASRRLLAYTLSLGKMKFDNNIEFSSISLIFDLLIQVGGTVATAVLTQRKGHVNDIFKHVQLWSLRPRAAAPTAILGFFHRGYVGKAIKLMVIDALLSAVALHYLILTIQRKTGVNAFFGDDWAKGNFTTEDLFSSSPRGPSGWNLYVKGGIVSLVPTSIFIFLLVVSVVTCVCPGASILLPLREACVTLGSFFRSAKNKKNPILYSWGTKLQWSLYTFAFLISFTLYIGNWMMWVNFLKVAGPLYCPGSLRKVDAIWYTAPLLMNLFSLLIDTYSDWKSISAPLGARKETSPNIAPRFDPSTYQENTGGPTGFPFCSRIPTGADFLSRDPVHDQGPGFQQQYPDFPPHTSQRTNQDLNASQNAGYSGPNYNTQYPAGPSSPVNSYGQDYHQGFQNADSPTFGSPGMPYNEGYPSNIGYPSIPVSPSPTFTPDSGYNYRTQFSDSPFPQKRQF